METTIYRTGQMRVASHAEDVFLHWAEFDMRRPAGHISRINALFAAPDLQGAHEWLCYRATRNPVNSPLLFHEITVESDNVRVYCIDDYDLVGPHDGNPDSRQLAHIDNYWNNSMTLTSWMGEVGDDLYGRWEVLLPEQEPISSRAIAYPELRGMYQEYGLDYERLDDLERHVRVKMEYDPENPFLAIQRSLVKTQIYDFAL